MSIVMDFEEGGKACLAQYRDIVFMDAMFPASSEKLQTLLPTKKLQPVESTRGITHVTMGALEYRGWYSVRRGMDQMLPYNEWAFIVPVNYVSGKAPPVEGGYVVWMPVTHEIPMRAGVEGWGLNKFMSEIKFSETRDARTCEVTVDGKRIVRFSVKRLVGPELQNDRFVFARKGDVLTRTLTQWRGELGVGRGVGSASFDLGDHPIAEQLASVGLINRPVEARYGSKVRANLHMVNETLAL